MIKYKKYKTYSEYKSHQSSKIVNRPDIYKKVNMSSYVNQFLKEFSLFSKFFKPHPHILCLGARTGAEVLAFRKMGFTSIGIDVNPLNTDKSLVIQGDFHKLPFDPCSFDVVYCNAIDHSLDLHALISEIDFILISGGILVLRFLNFSDKGEYTSCFWDKPEDILDTLEPFGLTSFFNTSVSFDGYEWLIHCFTKKEPVVI